MKPRLYRDPQKRKDRTVLKRLASENRWGVLFILSLTALGLLGSYLHSGAPGVIVMAFVGIVASTARLQAAHILAAFHPEGDLA